MLLLLLAYKILWHQLSWRLAVFFADGIKVSTIFNKKFCDIQSVVLECDNQWKRKDKCCTTSVGDVFIQWEIPILFRLELLDFLKISR